MSNLRSQLGIPAIGQWIEATNVKAAMDAGAARKRMARRYLSECAHPTLAAADKE